MATRLKMTGCLFATLCARMRSGFAQGGNGLRTAARTSGVSHETEWRMCQRTGAETKQHIDTERPSNSSSAASASSR